MTNKENPIHRIKSYLGFGSGSVSGSGSGSIITDADPRIQIRIKMIWIRNTAYIDDCYKLFKQKIHFFGWKVRGQNIFRLFVSLKKKIKDNIHNLHIIS